MSTAKRISILIFVFLTISYVCLGTSFAKDIYVDKNNELASDSNSGGEQDPLLSLRKAFDIAEPDDTIYIMSGTYDIDSLKQNIKIPLTIIGEDKADTIIKNGETFVIRESFSIKNITFERFHKPVFYITRSDDKEIINVNFNNCVFRKTSSGIRTLAPLSGVKNVVISHSMFTNMSGDEVTAIRIGHGSTEYINIHHNTFSNLNASAGGAVAIMVGSNDTIDKTNNIQINNNYIKDINGIVQENVETKGILAYGSNVEINYNKIDKLNEGQDHEAIYLKGYNSTIRKNILKDVGNGAGGGDIAIKGAESTYNNQIIENIIVSELSGRAIFVNGGGIIKSNFIKKPNSSGILVYPYEQDFTIDENHVYSNGTSVYIIDGLNANVSNNYAVSLNSQAIKEDSSDGTVLTNNIECTGSSCDVPDFPGSLLPSAPINIHVNVANIDS